MDNQQYCPKRMSEYLEGLLAHWLETLEECHLHVRVRRGFGQGPWPRTGVKVNLNVSDQSEQLLLSA